MPHAWQPVTVTVTNPKDGAAFNGEVAISQGSDTWTTRIALPAGPSVATATLTIYESPETWRQHLVSLRSDRGEGGVTQSWNPAVKPERLVRILVVSNDGSARDWEALDGEGSPVHTSEGRLIPAALDRSATMNGPGISNDHYLSVVTATPHQLTESAADLDQFGIVVLKAGVSLSEPQNAAVKRWVNAGGVLLDPTQAASSAVALHGAGRLVGMDHVTNLSALVAAQNSVTSLRARGMSGGLFPEVLQSTGVQAPPFSTIALFLGAYLIAVVPLQYIILRRLDKREWAWGTTPLLACGFAVAAYVVGSQGREREVSYNCAAVIETGAGQTTGAAVVRFGLYSPSRTTFSLAAPTADSVFFSSMSDVQELTQAQAPGQPTRLPSFTVPQWAMRSVSLHASDLPLGGGVSADFKRDGAFLVGTLTNNTGVLLENILVNFGGQSMNIRALRSGESHAIRLPWTDRVHRDTRVSFSNTAYSTHLIYPLLESTLATWNDYGENNDVPRAQEAIITAFTTQELVPVIVGGAVPHPKKTNSLLIVHAPVDAP